VIANRIEAELIILGRLDVTQSHTSGAIAYFQVSLGRLCICLISGG